LASAYATTLLIITTAGIYFVSKLSSSGSKYATMTGKGFRPRQIDLGPWRWVAAAVFITYFLLIVVLPFAVLLWSSFQQFYSVPSWQALQNLTLEPYRFVLNYPNLTRSVWNSLVLSFSSATLIMLVTSVICWIVVKTKLSNRQKHEIFTKDLRAEILMAISEKRFDKNRILVLNLFKVFGEEGRQLRRLAEEDEKNAMFWKQNKLSLPMADVRAVLPEWLTITCQPADEGHYWPRILLHMKGFRP
jgi:hypothetical protein